MKLESILFLVIFSVLIGNVITLFSVHDKSETYEYVSSNDDSLEENTELSDE